MLAAEPHGQVSGERDPLDLEYSTLLYCWSGACHDLFICEAGQSLPQTMMSLPLRNCTTFSASRLRLLTSIRPRLLQWHRPISTKHPNGFVPPTRDDLEELRDRTREFARRSKHSAQCRHFADLPSLGREITEEVAQRTDHHNEFPMDMWGKLGEAG